jgi:methyl-accepting chemotaxis protein
MSVTIRTKLLGLATTSLVFVSSVGLTGYWGVSTLDRTAAEVASLGEAIRNHIEAGVYNDLTRRDISSVFSSKGDDQQSAVDELKQHTGLLQDRIAKARSFATDSASQALLDRETQLSQQYVQAGDALTNAMLHNPSQAPALLGPYLNLYKELQGKIDETNDQLGKQELDAELSAKKASARANGAMLAICLFSLLILFCGSFVLLRSITRSINRLMAMIRDIAEGEGDVTKRLQVADSLRHDELGEVSRLFNLFMDKLQEILRGFASQTRKLTAASGQLLEASDQITANSGDTAVQSDSVSQATQQVTQHITSLSVGASEMTSTIQSIASNAREAAKVASSAVDAAQAANDTVSKLGQSSAEIGVVIKVITSIAEQTNLLALNATIEAARAGEAGKGFAVVANEVKELAKQTAKATDDIGHKIGAIQADTQGAIEAIGTVTAVIHQINTISATIAAAVEEQSATTNEMTRNAGEAANGAGNISANIGNVARAANGTLTRAKESQKAAQDLSLIASHLGKLIKQFKIERSERRYELALPVEFAAVDADGNPLMQSVTTVNISRRGTLVKGVSGRLSIASNVHLSRKSKSEEFAVVSIGKDDRAGYIGLSAVDPNSTFWDDVLEPESKENLSIPTQPFSRKISEVSHAAAN